MRSSAKYFDNNKAPKFFKYRFYTMAPPEGQDLAAAPDAFEVGYATLGMLRCVYRDAGREGLGKLLLTSGQGRCKGVY